MLAAELLEAGESLVEDVQRGAVAEADALVVAEGDAWDGGDLVAGKQLVTKIQRFQTHLAGVDEEVERAEWLDDADVIDRLETGEHELALDVILATQVFDEALIALEGSESTILRK